MNITYSYKIVSVDEKTKSMTIRYTSEKYGTVMIGAPLPYENETLESIIERYSPIASWLEKEKKVIVPAINTTGIIEKNMEIIFSDDGNITFTPIPNIDELKIQRNELLRASDWTQLSDAALTLELKLVWADYRQTLRDIPQQQGFPDDFYWPWKPNYTGPR